MRKTLMIMMAVLMTAFSLCHSQKITDSSYRSVGYIKADGTIQDTSYRTVGHIKKDGTIQDSSYRTIGHLKSDGTVQCRIPRTGR